MPFVRGRSQMNAASPAGFATLRTAMALPSSPMTLRLSLTNVPDAQVTMKIVSVSSSSTSATDGGGVTGSGAVVVGG